MNNNNNGGWYSGQQNYSRQQNMNGYHSPQQRPRRGGMDDDGRILKLIVLLCAIVAIIAVFYISCSMCSRCGSCAGAEQDSQIIEQEPVVEQEPEIATVRVTFPEGYNIRQMGQRLEDNGVCSASDFYDVMNTTDFSAEYDFLPSLDKLDEREYHLEGYMFPDTYDFYVGESADSVIRRFLNNFDAKIGDDLRQAALQTGEFYGTETDLDDIVIMASIVEREISVPDEMDGVAAVFWNRIKYPGGTVNGSATGGYFQSDATKFYPYVFNVDEVPEGFVSDYNTFNVKGLPKGPICCPSYEAIEASINPDHHVDAFFFYTDINKKVYYAVTLSEHQKNWQYCVDNGLNPW